jgi:hypothetical protein
MDLMWYTCGGYTCDCAFVKNTSTRGLENKIYAPEVGSTYPIASRVGSSAQQKGVFLNISGVGSGVKYGDIYAVTNSAVVLNISVVGGDSGAPVCKPLVSGSADLYGMIYGSSGSKPTYVPWHYIKSALNLTD